MKEKHTVKSNPLISIIIPVYNAEIFLGRCLDSILNQDCDSYEVILVNDGSTDHSEEICNIFAQKYPNQIRYFRQNNSGPATARNKGIISSRGKYLMFIDSDDYAALDMVSTMTRVAEQYNADMVICAYWLCKGADQKCINYTLPAGLYEGIKVKEVALSLMRESTGDIPPYSWTRLIKKEILQIHNLSFQNGLVRSEDYHFWVKVHFSCQSVYLLSTTQLYYYIENSLSITHRYISGYWKDVLYIYTDLYKSLPVDDSVHRAIDKMLIKRSLIAINNAVMNKTWSGVYKEIKTIVNNDILNDVIAAHSEEQEGSFMAYRQLMLRNKKKRIIFKYLIRHFRYLIMHRISI